MFEEKYAGFSTEELVATRETVEQLYASSKKTAFDSRHDSGLFDRYVVSPGQPARLEAGSKAPLWRVYEPANSNERHLVVLPPNEYSDIYQLDDELQWLKKKTK